MKDRNTAIEDQGSGIAEAPRGRGRPRAAEPMEPVTTHLPRGEYEKICRAAWQQNLTVSALLRQLVIIRLPKSE